MTFITEVSPLLGVCLEYETDWKTSDATDLADREDCKM